MIAGEIKSSGFTGRPEYRGGGRLRRTCAANPLPGAADSV
jgi:hypothetical protein